MEEKGCKRCGEGKGNTYKKGLPRSVVLCDGCYKKFAWARVERKSLWNNDPNGFIDGYIKGAISPYPDNEDYQRRLALRALYRLRNKRVKQRVAMARSFQARKDDVILASKILGEKFEKTAKKILPGIPLVADTMNEVSSGIIAIEGRMKKLLEQDLVYTRYLKNIDGPGVVVCAGLIGEIGSARTLLCTQHWRGGFTRPRLLSECEHGKDIELSEALLVSHPSQRAYGADAFPTTGNLRSFFGLGFRESGAMGGDGEKWLFRNNPVAGGDLNYSRLRKTLVVEYLGGTFERKLGTAYNELYKQEKEQKLLQWRQWFADRPPKVCSACSASGCKKCDNHSGKWERPKKSDQAIWVCRCHSSGYWFGSPMHVRNHARGKAASIFLDLLLHSWKFIEGTGEDVNHELAKMHLR
ncbi:MAG: hypothetical protein ABH887_01950 [bacterium]